MKRWFYILMGGLGICLALASAFMLCQPPFVTLGYQKIVTISEFVSIPLGIAMAWIGLVNGRSAGEFDIGAYNRASRKRDHHVAGTEIDFSCPVCHKGYRASPLLAGKPFTCRECNQVFDVPKKSQPPQVDPSHLLPAPVQVELV